MGQKPEIPPPFYSDEYYAQLVNEHRHILLYGEINEEKAFEINNKLLGMSILNNKQPIIMEINSEGGCCSEGLSIINTIHQIPPNIITYISGEAASMSALISVCGQIRLINENSFWMMHPLSAWIGDYLPFMKDRSKYLDRLDAILNDILKQKTKLLPCHYQKIQNGELWLSAQEAKKYKIVERII